MIITSSQESNVEPHSSDAIESKGLLRFLALEETGFHKKANVFKLSFFIRKKKGWGKKEYIFHSQSVRAQHVMTMHW